MKYNRQGRTELSVSAVGLGGWAFGGGKDWGETDEASVLSTVSAALEAGINLIDTAPIYGDGESETRLGLALQGRRDKVILATKCGLVKNGSWTDHDLTPQTISRQLEESLTRLKTDYIDLYQIHYPDPKVPLEDALGTLSRLQEQGKIRHIGVCNMDAQDLTRATGVTEIVSVQNEYSILHPGKGDDVFSACRELEIGFIGYGALSGGILSGKYTCEPNLRRADARNYFYKCYKGDAFTQAQTKAERLVKLAAHMGVAAASLAVAWALSAPRVSCALTGARSPKQISENAAGADVLISPQDLAFIEGRKCSCLK